MFNKKLYVVTLAVVFGFTSFGGTVFAVEGQQRTDRSGKVEGQKSGSGKMMAVEVSGSFCSRINDVVQKITTQTQQKQGSVASKKTELMQKVRERADKKEANLEKARTSSDDALKKMLGKLKATATTDAQKQAVITYESAIKTATQTRRAAVDKAISDYEAALSQFTVSRNQAFTTAGETFTTALKTAATKAQTDCAAQMDSSVVQKTFNSSIRTAQQTFDKSRKAMDTMIGDVQKLIKTRDAAIKKAMDEFKKTSNAAAKTLKAAFPRTQESEVKPPVTSNMPEPVLAE
jgi:hypothetical protein